MKEISIFINGCHLEWRMWLSDIIFKGDIRRTIPAKIGLIWFCENRYKSVERNISQ